MGSFFYIQHIYMLGLLTLIIVLLIVIIVVDRRNRKCGCSPLPPVITLETKKDIAPVKPETQSIESNVEYFDSCTMDLTKHIVDSCNNDDYKYAYNDFGAPGADFKDWVSSQAVDNNVIKNHAEYVSDRESTTTQNITGRTFSPDSHDSYDPIPWIGLRRPQAVPVCNPTQVPDVDYNLYDKSPKLTWKSS